MGEVFGLAAIACARANALFADFLPIGEKVGVGDYPDPLRASAGMYPWSLSTPGYFLTVTHLSKPHLMRDGVCGLGSGRRRVLYMSDSKAAFLPSHRSG